MAHLGPLPSQSKLRFGAFELDAAAGELRRSNIPLKIHPQPFKVLLLLARHAGQVVTREQIQDCLWGSNTFVDFERGINFCINQIRSALGDNAENPRYIETLPRHGYRLIVPVVATGISSAARIGPAVAQVVVMHPAGAEILESPAPSKATANSVRTRFGKNFWKVAAVATALLAAVLAAWRWLPIRKAPGLSATDLVVLADFANSTGDPVFDDTLKQALSIQLEQSPYLSLISEQRIQQTLRLMSQPPDTRLTPKLARELCLRTDSAVALEGTIAKLGSDYVLGLKAVNCRTGDSLAQVQGTAHGKELVLKALDEAVVKLRSKLGESLATVEKYSTPIEQATTPSLEALQAYTMGKKAMMQKSNYAATVPAYKEAIRLDPNFAMAYSSLSVAYWVLGEDELGIECARKAYEVRAGVSEREKFYIESHYFQFATGELDKALQVYETWLQVYPRDDIPHNNLGDISARLGLYDRNLAEYRESRRLAPGNGHSHSYLTLAYLLANRFEEAHATAAEAQAKQLDSPTLRLWLYLLAFVENDAEGMAQQVAWSQGKPGFEDILLADEADTAAYFGRLGKARDYSRRAVTSALHVEEKETAAYYESDAALREAFYGNSGMARNRSASALKLSTGREVEFKAALALALAGDTSQSRILMEDLNKRFPKDSILQLSYLPTVDAQRELSLNNPSKSVEILKVAAPYDLGTLATGGYAMALYSVYVRGEAYLAVHQGREAAVEFQRILDHPGIVTNEPIGAFARLQVARAHKLAGDTARARAAYQGFLTLWKDADPDIPILKQAKAEYANLQ